MKDMYKNGLLPKAIAWFGVWLAAPMLCTYVVGVATHRLLEIYFNTNSSQS